MSILSPFLLTLASNNCEKFLVKLRNRFASCQTLNVPEHSRKFRLRGSWDCHGFFLNSASERSALAWVPQKANLFSKIPFRRLGGQYSELHRHAIAAEIRECKVCFGWVAISTEDHWQIYLLTNRGVNNKWEACLPSISASQRSALARYRRKGNLFSRITFPIKIAWQTGKQEEKFSIVQLGQDVF